MDEVWSRVREGRHVVLVGSPPLPPDAAEGEPRWAVVRVGCDGPWSTWGPLEAARSRIEALLGEPRSRRGETVDRVGSSARVLDGLPLRGDLAEATVEAMLVSAANRLATREPGRSALVLDGLESADEATVQALREIVERDGWLRLPLVLAVRRLPDQGPLAELLEALDEEPLVLEVAADPSGFDWTGLRSEHLLVMRAAAVVGRSFEVELVGRLLGVSADAVLLRLQQIADKGAPLVDHGGGRFFIPEAARHVLVQRVLPSLVERWHRRLGEILAEPVPPSAAPTHEPPAPDDEALADASSSATMTYGEIFEASAKSGLSVPPREAPSEELHRGGEARAPAPTPDPSATFRLDPEDYERAMGSEARDQARAAHHLSEAGLPERAIEQYLAALRNVALRGDSRRALLIAEHALALLERQPPSRARELLHARVLAAAARVRWRGVGRGASLTLQGALETLDQAEQLIGPDGPLELRIEVALLVAGVCYDLGDIASLQRALDVLTEAARGLLAAGESVLAARLLNDQAAVYLRAGDPVRANHLLQQSRSVFDELHRERPDDPAVIIERAETEHLLARLPLHARLRAGREDEAFSLALGHARAAVEGYRRLGGGVEVGRVAETMGRLELARGRHDRAAQHLELALRTSRELSDVIGLARTTAALAELYIAANRPAEALQALQESVAFNYDKGSPLGLAVNRRTLASLHEALGAQPHELPELVHELREIETTLASAETILGRVSVPGDVD